MARNDESKQNDTPMARHVRSNMRVFADLFRAAPWRRAPAIEGRTIEVTIPTLGVREGAILVLGVEDDPTQGFLVFATREDASRFLDATVARRANLPVVFPEALALTFEPPASPEARARAEREQWDLAAPDAFPCLTHIDSTYSYRRCRGAETATIVAIASVLPTFLSDTSRRGPWTVTVHGDDVALSMRIGDVRAVTDDPLTALQALERSAPLDHFQRIAIEEELLREFTWELDVRALRVGLENVPRPVLDIAAFQFGRTLASLDAPTLERVLFDVLPGSVALPAHEVPGFVDGVRSFLRFVRARHRLPQAKALLAVLGRDAVPRLAARIHAVAPAWVPDLTGHPDV
jgi:hypothetical protein